MGHACCFGGTPYQHPGLSPCPTDTTHLCYYCYRCDSTAVTPLHLVSSPEPFGRCVAARKRTERREANGREEFQNKSSVSRRLRCGDSSTVKWQYRSFTFPLLYIPIYAVPVDVPCMSFFFFWFFAVPVITNCGGQES